MEALLRQIRGELRTVTAGATLRDRLRILRVLSHAHLHLGRGRRLFGWLPEGDQGEIEIRLRSGLRLLVRPQDAIVLYEHIGADIYDVPLGPGRIETVVDLGANIGLATLALAARHPGARFVCVEPESVTRDLLRRNLEGNGVRAEILDVAVVGKPGRFSLDASHFAAANQFVAQDDGDIDGITLEQLLERTGLEHVDLLKVDIEGAERGMFEAAERWAPRVRTIVGELHDGLTEVETARLLAPHGFRPLEPPCPGVTAFVK